MATLLHPASYALNSVLTRLLARATAAGDTDQSTAITALFVAINDAATAGTNLQLADLPADPNGHYGRHLKWMAQDLLYRSLDNADIATDLAAIAADAGVSAADYVGTVLINDLAAGFLHGSSTIGEFIPSLTGFPLMAGSSWSQFTINSSNQMEWLTTGLESAYATVDLVLPNYSATPITLTYDGTNSWDATVAAAVRTYIISELGNNMPFEITLP